MTTRIERDTLLAATDLAALATEFCGAPTGHGRGARWHCPNRDHPDHHPSMTIYEGHRNQRWHCHSCGAGGTAIDLYANATGHPIGETIRNLAQRAGINTGDGPTTPSATRLLPTKRAETPFEEPRTPDPAIEMYVAAAQRLLWSPSGQGALEYLRGRGLADRELLTINRVGYDPGPRELPRAKGLPHQGSGIVLPALDDNGLAIFCNTRYFDEAKAGRRYDNPTTELAPNPKIARIRPAIDEHHETIIVAEGIIDALTAAHHGYNAVAVLGVTNAGQPVADRIAEWFQGQSALIAFDNDKAGRSGAVTLAGCMVARGQTPKILRNVANDLNALPAHDATRIFNSACTSPHTHVFHDTFISASASPNQRTSLAIPVTALP